MDERLTEYCQRCIRVKSPLLEVIVDSTWAALGQIDDRRAKVSYNLYREVPPDELQLQIVGSCVVKKKLDKGWLGVSEDGTTVTGSDLEVVEIILLDWK